MKQPSTFFVDSQGAVNTIKVHVVTLISVPQLQQEEKYIWKSLQSEEFWQGNQKQVISIHLPSRNNAIKV